MLSNYQTVYLLNKVRRIIDKTENPELLEAIDSAISALNMAKTLEPCIYESRYECTILLEKNCLNCKFRKSKKEKEESDKKVSERLEKLQKYIDKAGIIHYY